MAPLEIKNAAESWPHSGCCSSAFKRRFHAARTLPHVFSLLSAYLFSLVTAISQCALSQVSQRLCFADQSYGRRSHEPTIVHINGNRSVRDHRARVVCASQAYRKPLHSIQKTVATEDCLSIRSPSLSCSPQTAAVTAQTSFASATSIADPSTIACYRCPALNYVCPTAGSEIPCNVSWKARSLPL